jgi:HK97 family phage major capsid protein
MPELDTASNQEVLQEFKNTSEFVTGKLGEMTEKSKKDFADFVSNMKQETSATKTEHDAKIEKWGGDILTAQEAIKEEMKTRIDTLELTIQTQKATDMATGSLEITPEEIKTFDIMRNSIGVNFKGQEFSDMVRHTAEQVKTYNEAFDFYLRLGAKEGLNTAKANACKFVTEEHKAALQVGLSELGGFHVKPTILNKIIKRVDETSNMRRRCAVETIGSNTAKMDVDLNNIAAKYVGERGHSTEQEAPKTGEHEISVHTVDYMTSRSLQVVRDSSFDFDGWITRKVGKGKMLAENLNHFRGNGVDRPWGILEYPTAASNYRYIERPVTAIATTGPTYLQLLDIQLSLKADYAQGANWFIKRNQMSKLLTLEDTAGSLIFKPATALPGGAYHLPTLLDDPYDFADAMYTFAAGDTGKDSIAYGNFEEGYLIIEREGISMLRFQESTNPRKVLLYFYWSNGGDVFNPEAIKLGRNA